MLQKTPSRSLLVSKRRGVGPLDVGWLEDLVAIADHRNFTKAAEVRNFTQPALSRRIQSLELWAGASLIDRTCTPLALTDEGKKLLHASVEVLERLTETRAAIHGEDKRVAQASVRLAATPVLSTSFLPCWLPLVQRHFEGSRISVSTKSLLNCFEALESRSVDFVVGLLHPETQFRSAEFALFFDLCSSITLGSDRLIPMSAPD